METTARGFKIYDRIETARGEVRVQESSAVAPHIWIFQGQSKDEQYPAQAQAVHLNPGEARRVAAALLAWANCEDPVDAR